jgi:antitoxin component of RelBE/YafQ-DinJ toxin-antitoxin module
MGRRANIFARIVVDDETWAHFKAIAAEAGLTAARAVGLLVEGHDG